MCGIDIEKSICREMSGNLESGMLAVGETPPLFTLSALSTGQLMHIPSLHLLCDLRVDF